MSQKVKKQKASMRFCLICRARRKFVLSKNETYSYCSICHNMEIFEGRIRECIRQCLDKGYLPLNIKELWLAKQKGLISKNVSYTSRTIFVKGNFKDLTKTELKKIVMMNDKEIFFKKLFLICIQDHNDTLYSDGNLVNDGRFVGVKKK